MVCQMHKMFCGFLAQMYNVKYVRNTQYELNISSSLINRGCRSQPINQEHPWTIIMNQHVLSVTQIRRSFIVSYTQLSQINGWLLLGKGRGEENRIVLALATPDIEILWANQPFCTVCSIVDSGVMSHLVLTRRKTQLLLITSNHLWDHLWLLARMRTGVMQGTAIQQVMAIPGVNLQE